MTRDATSDAGRRDVGLRDAWDAFLDRAERELDQAESADASTFPHFSEDGRWRRLSVDQRSAWHNGVYEHGNWTAGFWFGVMWLLASGRNHRRAADVASQRIPLLLPRADDATTHDLGFLFYPSVVLGLELDHLPPEVTAEAVGAARTLAGRFNHRGDYLQAFGPIGDARSAGTSTIDTMMNLPLLWWAANHGGDPLLADIARRHARTSARLFIREDGSTFHLNHYDPISGELVHRGTFQGESDRSCWSRGQAWAVCGFAWAFAAAGEPEFLAASERTAEYFWAHLPDNGVPPWDFGDQSSEAQRDSSAAAIAALGAVLLGGVHPDPEARRRYMQQGVELLGRISALCVDRSSREDGILLHSCYSKPQALGLDGATAWGDFYLGLGLVLANNILAAQQLIVGGHGSGATDAAMDTSGESSL